MAQQPSENGLEASAAADPQVPEAWYDRAFGEHYSRIYRRRDDAEAARHVALATAALGLTRRHRVLDLCCGGGRHLRELRARGIAPWGLDRSAALLAEARRDSETARRLVRGDMRRLPFGDGSFDAVVSFFTSFGYFFDEAENRQVLSEVARVLRDGGGALIDLMDRRTVIATLVTESERHVDGRVVRERRRISDDGTRVEKDIELDPGDGELLVFHESVRMYDLEEARESLAGAGLELRDVFGDFDGVPYDPGATPRMILVARKVPS